MTHVFVVNLNILSTGVFSFCLSVRRVCGNEAEEAGLLSWGSEHCSASCVLSGGVSGMFHQQVLPGVPEEPARARL